MVEKWQFVNSANCVKCMMAVWESITTCKILKILEMLKKSRYTGGGYCCPRKKNARCKKTLEATAV